MRRLRLPLALALSACASAPPEAPRGVLVRSTPASVGGEVPLSPYAILLPPNPAGRSVDLSAGRAGVLLQGRRVVVDRRGTLLELAEDPFAVNRVEELSERAGYLFLTSTGVGVAPHFTGEMRTIATGAFEDVTLGPGFVLARRSDGVVIAADLASGAPKKGLPLGFADVAAVGRRAIGLGHGGRVFATSDGDRWSDVTSRLDWTPTAVVADGDALFALSAVSSVAARLGDDGFTPAPMPQAPPPKDTLWPRSQHPLRAIATRGAPYGEDRAIVAEGGSVFVVSLRTAEVLESERGVLPPDRECAAIEAPGEVLFLCGTASGSAVFARSLQGGSTEHERSFLAPASFHVGADGALLFSGSCSLATSSPGTACIREEDGSWVEASRPEIADRPPEAPLRIVGWVPKPSGALMIVVGSGGGVWDLQTGTKTTFEDAEIQRLEALFSTSGHVIQRFAVEPGGAIAGLAQSGHGFRVYLESKRIELSPFHFPSAQHTGARVLASQGDRLFQSFDYGFSYREVVPPPLPGQTIPRACTAVGCVLGELARIGWPSKAPDTESAVRRPSHASVPPLAPAPRPLLRCELAGPAARKALPSGDERFGFGAELLRADGGATFAFFPRSVANPHAGDVEASNLRAMINGRLPAPSAGGAALGPNDTWRVRVLEPFDPKATVREATLRLRDVFDAVHAVGGPAPDIALSAEQGASLVVAGDPPSTLLSLGEGLAIWVRAPAPPLALSLGEGFFDVIVSAAQTGPDEVTVLTAGDEAAAIALGRGRVERRFAAGPPPDADVPLTPDALAVGASGELAMIRVTTRAPPSADAPALLLRPNAVPAALAPWSTLAVAGAPECEGMKGYRAVIATAEPWLRLGADDDLDTHRVGFALVRWSSERVCLDAIEVPAHAFDLDIGTVESYVAARFGKDGGAAHLFVAEGATLLEPRTCTIVP
jgi:hypothetical protein